LLADLYPDSSHVRDIGLKSATDTDVWEHAVRNELIIVSKDSDFHQRSLLFGHPPKIIWVRLGNCSTGTVETLLREQSDTIRAFVDDETAAFLILS
jgi:predicted nuclease of predicted toxin-antitoxin system